MEDEEPYPEGWAAEGSVAAASSSAADTAQHYPIHDKEDQEREWTEAEIADANRAYHSMMKDLVRQGQHVLTSGGEFSETSDDQDL